VNTGSDAFRVTSSIVNYGTSGYRLILTSDEEGRMDEPPETEAPPIAHHPWVRGCSARRRITPSPAATRATAFPQTTRPWGARSSSISRAPRAGRDDHHRRKQPGLAIDLAAGFPRIADILADASSSARVARMDRISLRESAARSMATALAASVDGDVTEPALSAP